jgi:hypothetical protein
MARFASLDITDPADVVALFNGTAVTAKLGGSSADPTIILSGHFFSLPGDSGAAIVDAAGKLVAIHSGGTSQRIFVKDKSEPVEIPIGRSQAIFARAALEALNAELLPVGQTSSGGLLATPGLAIARGPRPVADWTVIERVRAKVEGVPRGAQLSALIRRHFGEVRDLVHHHRRVLVTWHRYQGPGFVNAILRSSGEPGWPVPAEVAGVRLDDSVRAMRMYSWSRAARHCVPLSPTDDARSWRSSATRDVWTTCSAESVPAQMPVQRRYRL